MEKDSLVKDSKVGRVIKCLNGAFKHRFEREGYALGFDEATVMHGWIIGYLHHNKDREIYQKTIESEMSIGRSTVTALVKLLEKYGYINRIAVPGDARLKKLELTQKGEDIAVKTKNMLDGMEEAMLKGVEEKDLEIFFKVADKIRENLEDAEDKKM